MTDYDKIGRDPLSHLGYFTEWGGRSWERLVRMGIAGYLGGDLRELKVLDFGARFGRMSCLFALLGARVTGIDIHEACLEKARAEARNFGVPSQIDFVRYDGCAENLPQNAYDVVFSKSVLVLVDDLPGVLGGMEHVLNDKGKVVFVENGRGGPLLRLARRIKHRGRWDYTKAQYFTRNSVDLLRTKFNLERIERSFLPPIYLFCGTKRRDKQIATSDSDL